MENIYTILGEFDILDISTEKTAFASVNLNPTVTWIKFILTDDKPNANNQRVPKEEFDNLISTGIYMPIKSSEGAINDGHEDSKPLGVITHLKKVRNQIHGLAALWERERPEDVALIRERYANKQPLELSWEILFTESSVNDDGVEELRDTSLRAITFVGMPAYEGRTSVTALASSDSNMEDEKLDEIKELKDQLESVNTQLEEKSSKIEDLQSKLDQYESELAQLREFKSSIEQEEREKQKLEEIKSKFVEAGIEKDDQYFVDNKDKLLNADSSVLDFMIQELASFASATASKQPLEKKPVVPDLVSKSTGEVSVSDMVNYLRNKRE